jgi:hypothetical protein
MNCSSSIVSTIKKINDIPMSTSITSFCSHCSRAKTHKLPFYPSTTTISALLQVVHANLWGASPVTSHNGNRFYVHFTDEFSRFSWFYSCASKSDVFRIFVVFKEKVKNLLSSTINCAV